MRITVALAALLSVSAFAAEDAPFRESKIRAIRAHGPWPAAATTDPGNRVSGRRAAVELGERLFFDTRLSTNGRFSCGTCLRHYSERGSSTVKPLKLTAAEQTDLVVFLESLSTLSNPWRPEDHGRCQ